MTPLRRKIFRLHGNAPSRLPALPALRGEQVEMGEGVWAASPPTPLFPLFPPPHAALRRGEEAREWDYFAMDSTAE